MQIGVPSSCVRIRIANCCNTRVYAKPKSSHVSQILSPNSSNASIKILPNDLSHKSVTQSVEFIDISLNLRVNISNELCAEI